ncbi:hypothetical protein SLA2020_338900 [Shorea laevis]
MEFANRVVSAAKKATNNNAVINVCLVGSFAALAVRSVSQQRNIEALEAHKDSLTHSNKAMKKAMWEWKQQLFAEASSTDSALVPLARLKAIYGEAVEPQIGDTLKEDAKSSASKFVV